MISELDHFPSGRKLQVLEVGAGTGAMVERMAASGRLKNAAYTALEQDPDLVDEALRLLPEWVDSQGGAVRIQDSRSARVTGQDTGIDLTFMRVNLFDFLTSLEAQRQFDLLIAHAFLDLVDLKSTLPRLLQLVRQGGHFYFTINFDGVTLYHPQLDTEADRHIIALYHRTMDERLVDGRASGDSTTGRRLFLELPRAYGRILAAGASDWVVFPGPDGYPADEAYFLHFLVNTVESALDGHPEIKRKTLSKWADERHRQIENHSLIHVAHQMDFFGVKEAMP